MMAATRRRTAAASAAMGALLLFGACTIADPARAADPWPTRPVKIVVPFSAAGTADLLARIVADKLGSSLGQPFIVEHRPGAGGIIGQEQVARAAPDGYTFVVSSLGSFIISPVFTPVPFDPFKDFTHIAYLGGQPVVLFVNKAAPYRSLADLVAYAKANADKMNYSSSSATFQLVTELFKQKTGAPMQVIPYKSANESVLAVISGQVTTTIADAGPVIQQVKSGTARALAVATPKRVDDLPDVPTLKESGIDVEAVLWSGIFVPKGTPPAIVKKLEGEFMRIARLPDVINRLKPLGIDTIGNSSEEFAKILADDIARWGAVAKAANIKMQQ